MLQKAFRNKLYVSLPFDISIMNWNFVLNFESIIIEINYSIISNEDEYNLFKSTVWYV